MENGKEIIMAEDERSSLCSLCGDVGFQEALLPCRASGCTRLQHTYCGRYCPEMMDDAGRWRCEWCAPPCLPGVDEDDEEDMPSPQKRARRAAPRPPSPPSDDRSKVGKEEVGQTRNSRAMDRWRSLAKRTRLGGKKYKLLADVLCFPTADRTSTVPLA